MHDFFYCNILQKEYILVISSFPVLFCCIAIVVWIMPSLFIAVFPLWRHREHLYKRDLANALFLYNCREVCCYNVWCLAIKCWRQSWKVRSLSNIQHSAVTPTPQYQYPRFEHICWLFIFNYIEEWWSHRFLSKRWHCYYFMHYIHVEK